MCALDHPWASRPKKDAAKQNRNPMTTSKFLTINTAYTHSKGNKTR